MSETSKRVLATDWSEPTDEGSVARACVTLAREVEALEAECLDVARRCEPWLSRAIAAERKLDEARDCGQAGVCAIAPGCQRHWEERNRELVGKLERVRGVAWYWTGDAEDALAEIRAILDDKGAK